MAAAPNSSFETDKGPGSFLLLESAIHLLRRMPFHDHFWHFAGGIPWVLTCLGVWSWASWFKPNEAQLFWAALWVLGAFGWLKACQHAYAQTLLARRRNQEPPPVPLKALLRAIPGQLRTHVYGLILLPLSALATFPLGYVWNYYGLRSITDREGAKSHAAAAKLTRLWPMQTHILLVLASLMAFLIWLNILALFVIMPALAKMLLGVESLFGLSGWTVTNSSFLLGSVLCTWLFVDPLFKALHVLRYYHGRALSSGEDLEEAFTGALRRRLGVAALVLLGLLSLPFDLQAKGAAGESATVSTEAPLFVPAGGLGVERLDQSLRETRERPLFSWRLRPKQEPASDAERSMLRKFFEDTVEMIREMKRSVSNFFERMRRWFDRLAGGDGKKHQDTDSEAEAGGGGAGGAFVVTRVLLYGLLAVLGGVLCWLVYLVWRQSRRQNTGRVLAQAPGAAAPAPDLRDETVHAAQLPCEGWLALAKEQMQLGEWRLAFRALYLAQLARYADEGLVRLARYKTNSEYEAELRRKVPQHAEQLSVFGQRRRHFDAVWYGRETVNETLLPGWLKELEGGRS